MSHGNGLAADFYYPFWSLFLDEFEVVVYDCRNHGWNRTGPQEEHNPRVFAEDLDEAILPRGRTGLRQETHGRLLPFDLGARESPAPLTGCRFRGPPAVRSAHLPSRDLPDAAGPAGGTGPRRSCGSGRSTSRRTRISSVSTPDRRCFAGWGRGNSNCWPRPRSVPRANGEGYELRCPPAYEAQALDFLTAYAAIVDIATIRCPVKVIGGDPTVQFAYLPSVDPDVVMAVDYDFVPETAPLPATGAVRDVCRDLAMEFFARLGLTAGGRRAAPGRAARASLPLPDAPPRGPAGTCDCDDEGTPARECPERADHAAVLPGRGFPARPAPGHVPDPPGSTGTSSSGAALTTCTPREPPGPRPARF